YIDVFGNPSRDQQGKTHLHPKKRRIIQTPGSGMAGHGFLYPYNVSLLGVVERSEKYPDNLIWTIPAKGRRLAKAPGHALGAFVFIACTTATAGVIPSS